MKLIHLPAQWRKLAGAAVLTGAAGCLAAAHNGQDTATRDFQKALPFASGQTFAIESKFGEIRIHGSNA